MILKSAEKEERHVNYTERGTEYYFAQMDPKILSSLNIDQKAAIHAALVQAIPKPSPKIVDLRIPIDLIFAQFFVVLFVGKDKRKDKRIYKTTAMTKFANVVAASVLLLGLNLIVSFFVLISAYTVKSLLGIDLFSSHLLDFFHLNLKH
jgi:hypothetical protein